MNHDAHHHVQRPHGAAAPRLRPRESAARLRVRFGGAADPSRAFIAEALVRSLGGGLVEGRADGDPARVDPVAREVMREIRVPLREGERGGDGGAPLDGAAELVILLCDRDAAPAPGELIVWRFDDPARAADAAARLHAFRRVRDEIKRRIDLMLLVSRRRLREEPERAERPRRRWAAW